VKIRNYEEKDLDDIKRIHALKGIDYELPDLQQPLFLVKKVLEVEGKVVMALGAYIQVETYLWLDPGPWATPQEKFDLLNELQHEFLKELWLQGVECAVCYVPEEIEKHFGKRLTQLGWSQNRDGWRTWGRSTKQ
jgi:hypothetical protein